MSNLLNISSSPHVRDKSSTRSIMWDVIFALIPTSIFGIYNFGIRAAVLIAVCIATCLLSEYIWQKCMKLPLTVNDGSAVLTGLLLALNLTPTFPIWMAILGSIFANVKSTNYNGKECYIIKGFPSSLSLTFEGAETYIEKDTGLYLKTIEGDRTTERKYEFDKVDDSIFIEPDISQYTLKEND